MITLRQNPNEPSLYIGSERGGGKLPSFAPESSPKLVATSPADNTGAVSTTPTIRLTFDTPVALGSGTFFVSDGTTQSYVDPGSGLPAVRIVGATHTLQFPASGATLGGGGYYVEFTPPGTLKSATEYFVYFQPGAIVGAGNGLPYAGLSDATMLNFVTSSDSTNPVALSAKTSNAAGVYNAGDVISITVFFSETVTVTGTPRLELNTAANRFATLSGPSTGTSLTFSYTVQAGDTATELGFVDLIDLASGIVDASGNPLTTGNIAFAAMDAAASTGQGSDLVIDTTAPLALTWNVVEGSTDVGYGSTLSLSFSEPVQAAAGAKLFVSINGTPTEVLFTDPSISISGNTVFMSGLAANTDYAVTVPPGAVQDLGGNALAGSAAISCATSATSPSGDTIAPKVLDVGTAGGATPIEYNVGSTVKIQVTMSETVNVTGTPKLQLQLDGKTVDALYASSTGKVLTFDYTVQAGDNAASLAYTGSAALLLPSGAAITDVKGNAALLNLPAVGAAHSLDANTNIEIDTDPTLSSAAPASGTSAVPLGSNVVLTFSEAMSLAGSDASFRLYRDDGTSATLIPTLASVNGNVLTLDPVASLEVNKNYYVQVDSTGLVDSDGNYFGGIAGTSTYVFNTNVDSTPPSATAAKTTTALGTYNSGDTITIEVSFSETVTVTGTPKLELNTGSGAGRFATLSGPASGTVLTFSYVVQDGDNTSELTLWDTGDLATGIADLNNNVLDQAHISFSTIGSASGSGYGSQIALDTTDPQVTGWSVADGATDAGTSVTLSFTEAIMSTGPGSQIMVSANGSAAVGVLLSNPSVTISGSTLTLGGLAQNTQYVLTLNAGQVADAGGNPYDGSSQVVFVTAASPVSGDTWAPAVLDVSAPSGSTATVLGNGGQADIQVTMSEAVTVTGTPLLNLQVGADVVQASYTGMVGKVLTFHYAVAAGQNTASLATTSTSPLDMNGGSIRDAKGNDASLAVPAPGSPHSLDANTNISVDTAPVIKTLAPFDGASAVALNNNMLLTFSEAMTLAGSASNFRLMRDDGGSSTAVPAVVTVTGTVVTFDPVSDLELNKNYYIEIDAGALTDSGGKAFTGLSGTGAYNFSTTVDTTKPSATLAQTTNAEGSYKVGDTITIRVTFDETVTVTGSPRLELNTGASTKFATHTGAATGTTLDFAYVVEEGDFSASLDFANLVGDMTGITDMAGNALDDAHITFTALTAALPSGYGSEITIDGISPQFSSFSAQDGMTDISAASPLLINFSESVKAAGPSSAIMVAIDGAAASPVLVSSLVAGSASTLPLPLSANKSYVVTIPSGTLTDNAGNPVAGSQTISFSTMASPTSGDTIVPKVLSVTANVGGDGTTLSQGEGVTLIVVMSEPIQVTGSIALNLQVGSQVVPVYATGHDGNQLYFSYTVAAGQNTPSLEYVNSSSLVLYDAFLRDMNNNNAVLTLPAPGAAGSLGYNTSIKVDTLPTVTATSPASGAWNVALGSDITFTFSEAMTKVGGASDFKLFRVGTPDVELPVSASVTGNVLTLNPAADLDPTQNYYVQIASGALVDSDSHPFAGYSGNSGFTFNTKVDTTAPLAQSWNFASGPTDLNAATTTATLTFDENVFAAASGNPHFILALNESDGTEEVALTDARVSISGNTISLNGFSSNTYYGIYFSNGSVVDAAGNAVASFPELKFGTAASPSNLDTIAAKILNVSASVGSSTVEYTNGNTISIQVTMSELVTVSGGIPAIKLQLNNGTVDALYSSNSGKLLTFTYTVQPGDNVGSLAYVDSSSLSLNGASILDQNGNYTTAILPAPGAAGSLDVNTNISINTAPVVTSFSPSDNTNSVPLSADLVLTFSENIVLAGSLSNVVLYRDEVTGGKTALPAVVNIVGNTLVINPDADFTINQSYHVEIAGTVLTDASGKPFAGIVGSTDFNFGTYTA